MGVNEASGGFQVRGDRNQNEQHVRARHSGLKLEAKHKIMFDGSQDEIDKLRTKSGSGSANKSERWGQGRL